MAMILCINVESMSGCIMIVNDVIIIAVEVVVVQAVSVAAVVAVIALSGSREPVW
jgi:hypothetical protein